MDPRAGHSSRFQATADHLLGAGPRQQGSFLVALCVLLYFGALGGRPFHTRGEPREGLVVQRMVAGGGWLVPERAPGEPARKPPLYYWLAAGAAYAAGEVSEWSLRLPSAVLATAGVLGTAAAGRALWGPAAGLLAGAILATSFEWTRAASNARVDMTFAACLGLGLAAAAVLLARPRPAVLGRWAVYAGVTLATLAKGPLGLALAALAVGGAAVVEPGRVRERLRPALGLVVVVALAGAWFVAALSRAGEPLAHLWAVENLGHLLATREAGTGHAHSALYLLSLTALGLLPWTPLLPLAARLREGPARAAVPLLVAWAVGGAILFTFASAKRAVYVLPLYPAVALLLAGGLVAAAQSAPPAAGAGRLLGTGYALALVLVALTAVTLAAGWEPERLLPALGRAGGGAEVEAALGALRAHGGLLLILALPSALLAAPARRAARCGRWTTLAMAVALGTAAWSACFTTIAYPALARARSLKPFLAEVRRLLPPEARLYTYGKPGPAIRFYARRVVEALPRHRRAPVPENSFLLVWERDWPALQPRFDPRNLPPLAVSAVQGRGHRGHLLLVAMDQPPRRARARRS